MEKLLSEANVHCEDCHYDTGWMNIKDVIFKLSIEGGYIISDKEGGYFSKCPNCESNNLSIEN